MINKTTTNSTNLRDFQNTEVDKKSKNTENYGINTTGLFKEYLKPGGGKAINPVIEFYTPDTKNDFYSEIEVAIKNNINFVCFVIDAMLDEEPFVTNCIQLIRFCQKHDITILNFQHEPDVKAGLTTTPKINTELGAYVKTIVKPSFSVFSVEQTHEELRALSPDALIIAGGEVDLCVVTSINGNHKEKYPEEEYGEEFGATDYGYSVYIQDGVVYPEDSKDVLKDLNKNTCFVFKQA